MKKAKPPRGPAAAFPALPAVARSWSGRAEGPWPRADAFIASAASGILSRSQLKARKAAVRVNGAAAKLSRPLAPGDRVEVEWLEEASPGIVPQDMPLSVLYEDERVIVVDKAQGMVTHPGAGNRGGTLANALLGRLVAGRSAADGPAAVADGPESWNQGFRGGVVHRLDKDTSGVIIAAKDPRSQAFLAAQFKDRLTRKEYVAVTRGIPQPMEGRIADRLGRDRRDRKRFARVEAGGKAAVTDYRVLAAWSAAAEGRPAGARRDGYAFVALRPRTGRTHQLRVHMAGLGCPILGDPIYGKRDARFPEATLMLHARRLKIVLPGELEPRIFVAPLPERFRILLGRLTAAFGPPARARL